MVMINTTIIAVADRKPRKIERKIRNYQRLENFIRIIQNSETVAIMDRNIFKSFDNLCFEKKDEFFISVEFIHGEK